MLPIDVAARSAGGVEDLIAGLDQSGGLQRPQEITGTDQSDPVVDDGAPPHDVAVLEQKQGLSIEIGVEKSSERLDRRSLSQAPCGTAFFETPKLVDADSGRGDMRPR